MKYQISFINRVNEIPCESWNKVVGKDYPFIRHEFLSALEVTGCVNDSTGWKPLHCVVHEGELLKAIMPMYEKTHSHGEYVFDFQWASAYRQHGKRYYPKWLTAIPFTPCEGQRLYCSEDVDKTEISKDVINFITESAEKVGVSSWHCLFPVEQEIETLRDVDLSIREGVQFRWQNKNYRDFQDYLDTFTSKRRKNLLRERRTIKEQGIELKTVQGKEITEQQWEVFYLFYQLTYAKRGNPPYLNPEFFQSIAQTMPDQIVMILAIKDKKYVGAALSFLGSDTYYGRYWGCHEEFDCLHFEACYYQGLEYCIENGLQRFDSGAQGEHKISRGFEPVTTYSAHLMLDAEFSEAIRRFTNSEAEMLIEYRAQAAELLPFKKDTKEEI